MLQFIKTRVARVKAAYQRTVEKVRKKYRTSKISWFDAFERQRISIENYRYDRAMKIIELIKFRRDERILGEIMPEDADEWISKYAPKPKSNLPKKTKMGRTHATAIELPDNTL